MKKASIKEKLIITILYVLGFFLKVVANFVKIEDDSALFVSFSGKNYDSNPRYFYEYLIKSHYSIRCTWAFEKPPNIKVEGCKQVKYGSMKYFITLLRSKYWFFDVGLTRGIELPTKKHVVVHFCHGCPYKMMGKDIKNATALDIFADYQIGRISNYILSQSPFSTNIFSKAYNAPKEKFLEIGYPRTDVLFLDKEYEYENKELLKLKDKKIILYLPTMREWNKKNAQYTSFIDKLKLNNDEIILFKAHPSNRIEITNPHVLDVTDISTINDLYMISDVLITDYSSAMFDFALTGKPVLLYQNDYEEYIRIRGLCIPNSDIPVDIFYEEDEICNAVERIIRSDELYNDGCEKAKKLANRFVGKDVCNTSEKLANILFNGE